jgi:hypothetical protein
MRALISKCKTWMQETGVNVLYAAFGFLEWNDRANNDTGFAPLILMGAQIEKKKTQAGPEFWIGAERRRSRSQHGARRETPSGLRD